MAIKLTRPLAATLVVMLLASTVGAQDLSRSSKITSAGGDEALGAKAAGQGQELTEGVPELEQSDRAKLRDKSTRGSFVGADSDGAGFFEGTSRGDDTGDRMRGSRQTRGTGSRGSFRPRDQQSKPGRSRGTTLRPRLVLGFHYTPKVSPQLAENMRTCIKRIPSLNGISSVRVSVQQNVVVLEGTVASARDRALSAQLVALSPGVNKIDNRLKVTGAAQ